MRILGLNALLSTAWALVQGSIDLANLTTGFVFGYVVLWLVRPALGETGYFHKLPAAVGFVLYFLKELLVSNVRVAWDVITPAARHRPGVVAVPLDLKNDAAITLLANVVTLTPGTLSLDVSADRRTLFVHGMFVDDPETFRRDIKEGFERRIEELLR
jgi:multicomponent Na+:H+ antiporter subunit E